MQDAITTPAGDVYYLAVSGDTPLLVRLTSTETVVWSRPFLHAPGVGFTIYDRALALTASGALAVLANGKLHVVSAANGEDVWVRPAAEARSVVAAPDGTIAVGAGFAPNPITIERYTATGTRLIPDWTETDGELDLAYDAQSYLVISVVTESLTATLTRIAPNGTVAFTNSQSVPAARTTQLAVVPDNTIVVARPDRWFGGLLLRAYSPAGALVWSVDRPSFDTATAPAVGVTPLGLAIDASGRVLVTGMHRLGIISSGIPVGRPFATVYDLP